MVIESKVTDDTPLPRYSVLFDPPDKWNEYIVNLRAKYIETEESSAPPRNLTETLDALQSIAILDFPEISREYVEPLSWAALGLLEIYLLLNDKNTSEVFCSHIGKYLVITHNKYGRCVTDIIFSKDFWNSLKARAEFDSGLSLGPLSPALKVGFSTTLGSLRLSLQVEPLAPDGPAFTLRRLPEKSITLEELVEQNQIDYKKADFLTQMIRGRYNIIIAGEPGSGKTTLANALLLLTEPSWRLIIIEDAREVRFSSHEFPLLTRYSIPAVGAENRMVQRTNEIARLLHRSPDYVFLGEIQTFDDTKATMEAFAAGIRGMATTHGRDFDGLMARWTESHKLTSELLRIIDVIVFTHRIFEGNKSKLKVGNIYTKRLDGGRFDGFEKVKFSE